MAYAQALRDTFLANAAPSEAMRMARSMRDRFPFFGIKSPQRRRLEREVRVSLGHLGPADALGEVRQLWRYPERECQYAAVGLLQRQLLAKSPQISPKTMLGVVEKLVSHKPWWDTIDTIAPSLLGWALRHEAGLRRETVGRWSDSEDMWFRRSLLLFQLRYGSATDFELLFQCCEAYLDDERDFVQRAIGRGLRAFARTSPGLVRQFVTAHTLMHPATARAALP